MIINVAFSDFVDAFRDMGRGDQFSYEGLQVLFEHMDAFEKDTGAPIELDVIALCCDFYEGAAAEVISDYGLDVDEDEDEGPEAVARVYLEEECVLVGETMGPFIYRAH